MLAARALRGSVLYLHFPTIWALVALRCSCALLIVLFRKSANFTHGSSSGGEERVSLTHNGKAAKSRYFTVSREIQPCWISRRKKTLKGWKSVIQVQVKPYERCNQIKSCHVVGAETFRFQVQGRPSLASSWTPVHMIYPQPTCECYLIKKPA